MGYKGIGQGQGVGSLMLHVAHSRVNNDLAITRAALAGYSHFRCTHHHSDALSYGMVLHLAVVN